MAKKKKVQVDIQQQALALVAEERAAWSDGVVFVSDRVAFNMRNLVRQLRKNYWGVFEVPTDPTTGRKKIWNPLTESLVEASVKNIDLDTKDINFRAKKAESVPLTSVIRSATKMRLDQMFFGESLDKLLRDLAIDGTAVWRTIEEKDEEGKPSIKIVPIDLLNVYIDPTSPSIQEAYRFTVRNLVFAQDVKNMKGWMNTEDVVGSLNLVRTDTDIPSQNSLSGTTKMVDLWEMYGKIPKSLITGKKSDEDIEIDGHIVASGLDGKGGEKLHLLEENKKGIKPFEEAWYTRTNNRWFGKGVAEKVMWLQVWINTITNIRINREYISQLGIFKVRKGSGISSKMLGRLASNGALMVKSMDDIEQLVMNEVGVGSFREEENIMQIAQRVTSAFDIAVGSALPASTSATATAIQSQSAQSAFVLIKEGVGMFLQRWLKRHAVPIIMKGLTAGEILRLTGDPDEVAAFDERLVNEQIYQAVDEANRQGFFLDPLQVENERQSALKKLQSMGNDRFVEMKSKIDPTKYDVQVYVTNEEIDKGVMLQNLIASLNLAPEFKEPILRTVFDIMGLDAGPLKATQPVLNQGTSPKPQSQSPQEVTTAANTLLPSNV